MDRRRATIACHVASRHLRHASPILLVAAVMLSPRVARSDEPISAHDAPAVSVEEGRKLFREAVEREDAGEYGIALDLYRRAKAHAVSSQLLFNLANCEEHLDHLLDATKTFREAKSAATSAANEEVRREASARLDALARTTPRLSVRRPPGREGLEVLLDGQRDFDDAGPVPVDPGEHRIEAKGSEGQAFQVSITLRRGDLRTVEVVFPETVGKGALAPAWPLPADVPTPRRPSLVPVGVSGGATIVLGIVTAATYAAGRTTKAHFVTLNDAPTEANTSERQDLLSEGRSLYTASTVFGISAAVAGAVTVVLLVRSLTTSSSLARPTVTKTFLSPTSGGFVLGGAL